MKIIAGIDKNFQGEVVFSPGYTVGYLEQEPKLDDAKTVREVVEEGCASTVALLKEYEEINQKLCEPMDDEEMARLIERQGELYEQIDHVNGWELDSVLERAMDALRCPDPDQSVKVLSGGERRRVALCRLLLQQDQALQPGGGRVKGQVVGPAKADPLLQLHHLFFTQFPDGQCPSPLSATAYAAAGRIMQKAVETAWQIVVYCGQSIP